MKCNFFLTSVVILCLGLASCQRTDRPKGATGLLTKIVESNLNYKVAFGDEERIYIMDPDGTNIESLTEKAGHAGYVSWSPDAKYIYFAGTAHKGNAWESFRVDIKTKKLQRISNIGLDTRFLGISPDNKYLAISVMSAASNKGDVSDDLSPFHTNLYIIEMSKVESILKAGKFLTKDDLTVLLSAPAEDFFWFEEVNWHPKIPTDSKAPLLAYGKTYKYDNDSVTYTHVYTIRADGTEKQLIVKNQSAPKWNFKGDILTFQGLEYYDFNDCKIKKMKVSGINDEIAAPTISPDGNFIIFEIGDRSRKIGLARVSDNTPNEGVIIPVSVNAYEPKWSPKPIE